MSASTGRGSPDHPDDYRMTVGEHLEELRRRLLLALAGLAVIAVVCFIFGDRVLLWFCRPLYAVLEARGLNTQISYDTLGEPFTSWIRVNLITAAALASPWIVYQIWLFVAAGLYPHERRWVLRFAPLSVGLLIAGMLFVYLLVLPWTIQFFLDFASSVPTPSGVVTTTQPHTPVVIPRLDGNPANPVEGELWIDTRSSRVRMFENGQIRSIKFAPENLLAPEIKLSDYIGLVVGMLLTFGLSFQLPLIVTALVRTGIVEPDLLRSGRRYVYFGMAIIAASITPGDVITASIALMLPLMGLYELGIWMAGKGPGLDESRA
jgi:sec-independent protein translocase protein TatC